MKKHIVVFITLLPLFTLNAQDDFVIQFGLVPDFPPTTFVDYNGNPTGFYIELFSRIIDELGYEYQFVVAPFREHYENLLHNHIDFFCTILRTPQREKLFYWPEEPVSTGWGQFFVKNGKILKNIQDLHNKKVGMVEDEAQGQNFLEYMKKLDIPIKPVYFTNFEELISAVVKEEVLGGVAYNTLILNEKRIQPTAIVFSPLASYATTSAGNVKMIPIVDQISARLEELKSDSQSYYWDLYDAWMATERIEQAVIPFWLIYFFLLCFIIIIMLFIFSRILKEKVQLRTQELSHLTASLEEKIEERTLDLKEASHKLIKSEKQALTSKLVAGVAHEINTPIGVALTALTYNQELLSKLNTSYKQEELDSEEFDKYLDRSSESMKICLVNLQRAIDLIQNFKNVSSDQIRDEMSVINLKEYTENIILAVYPELKKTRLKVHTNLADRMIQTYPGALTHIFINLILNTLRHGFDPGEEGHIYISFLKKENSCRILYSDTGKGIPPEIMDHIFEPFYTTNRHKGNSGLGLSILMNVLNDKLNGTIQLRSEPGRYTCFEINFPVHMIS